MAHVSTMVDAVEAQHFAIAFAVVAVCAMLVGLAFSLPGRSSDGVVLGLGTTIVAMVAVAHPHETRLIALLWAAIAVVSGVRAYLWARDDPDRAPSERRFTAARDFPRLGGFWLLVPVAVCAVVVDPAGVRYAYLAEVVAVFALVATAARRRGRDLSVGYVAGALIALAALVASGYGQRAGAGAVLAYPSDATGLLALACAGRIGVDRMFAPWQRIAALSVGAATVVAVASPVAFVAATMGAIAYLIFRIRARGHGVRAWTVAARAGPPLVVVAGLWALSAVSVPPARIPKLSVSLVRGGALGRLFGVARPGPLGVLTGAGAIGLVAVAVGAAMIVWRVTGPGLPLWVSVVGLAGIVGVLAAGGGVVGPAPAWMLAFTAELWVFCHGLRPDHDISSEVRLRSRRS